MVESSNHIGTFLCITKVDWYKAKSKHEIVYHSITSAMRPIAHGVDIPIPHAPLYLKNVTSDEKEDKYEEGANYTPKVRCYLHKKSSVICWKICVYQRMQWNILVLG